MARIETYNLDPIITLEEKVIDTNFIGTNWQVNACDGSSTTLALTINNNDVGKSGIIVIINPASGATFTSLPSYMKTPDGADPQFVTTGNAISIISYFVLATDKVLVNYVGNFS